MRNYKLKSIEKILIFLMGVSLPLISLRIDLKVYTISLYMASIIMLFTYVAIKNAKHSNLLSMTMNKKEVLIFVFLMVYCFSILYSPNMVYGLDRLTKIGIVVAFYMIIKFIIIKKPNYLDFVMNWSLISLSVYLSYLIYKYIFVFNTTYIGINTNYATGSGKNSLAFMVSILLAFVFGKIANLNRSKHNKVIILLYLVIISSVFLIQSRGLFLIFLIYIIVSLLLRRKNANSNIKTILLVLTCILLIALFLPESISSSILNRFSGLASILSRNSGLEDLSSSRAALIYRGIDLFTMSPVLGVGAGGFMYYNGVHQISHNDYVLVASEQGIIGILLFTSILISFLITAYRIYRVDPSPINKGILLSMIGIMIYFLFINAYDNILFWSVLAMISAKESIYKKQNFAKKYLQERNQNENIDQHR